MQDFKQCSSSLGKLKYDGVNTFCSAGCFVCSLADITDKQPTEVATILRNNGLFTDGYINDIAKAAQVLGLEYNGKSTSKPNYDTIAWTSYFDNAKTSAIEKHFFIVKADGNLIDPLGKGIYYPIKEYYLFRNKQGNGDEMIQQDDLDGRVFTYNGMGLLWVKGEWIGTDQNDKSKPLPNTWAVSLKPLPVDCSGETNPLNVQISKLNDKVDQLKTQNTTLVGHNTEFGKELETLHTLLEDSQVQIDDLKTQIENMTPEDQIVDSEPSGGLWQIIKNWFNKWKGNK